VEIQVAAHYLERRIRVIVMRPRDGEQTEQVFHPEKMVHGDLTLVQRPGHFNWARYCGANNRERKRLRCEQKQRVVANAGVQTGNIYYKYVVHGWEVEVRERFTGL
jgi:hypothetical protein